MGSPLDDRSAALARRARVPQTPGMVENTYQSIEATLRVLITDDASAAEVYSAMYDVAWVPLDSPAQTYQEAHDLADRDEGLWPFTWSAKNAGDLIGEARGKGEGWADVLMELPVESGVVSERVRRVMESLGLRPVL